MNGIGKEIKKTTLEVGGMTCTSCSQKVEKKLQELEGVDSARVNFSVEKAYVDYDPQVISLEDIIATVDDLGYKAKEKEEEMKKVSLKIGGMTCSSCAQEN